MLDVTVVNSETDNYYLCEFGIHHLPLQCSDRQVVLFPLGASQVLSMIYADSALVCSKTQENYFFNMGNRHIVALLYNDTLSDSLIMWYHIMYLKNSEEPGKNAVKTV